MQNYGHWSSGPLRGIKRDIWEGGHRVPFIVSWPGVIPAGMISNETVSQVDLAATLAGIIGYELDSGEAIDSYDLLPVLTGKKQRGFLGMSFLRSRKSRQPLRKATVQNTLRECLCPETGGLGLY